MVVLPAAAKGAEVVQEPEDESNEGDEQDADDDADHGIDAKLTGVLPPPQRLRRRRRLQL